MDEIKENKTHTVSDAPAAKPAPKKSGAGIWVVLIIVVIALGVGVAYTQGLFTMPTGENGATTGVPQDPGSVVATVNGEAITGAQLQAALTQVANTMGADVNEPEVVLMVLNNLVNIRLLEGEARAKGFTATDADVDAEIAQIVEMVGGEEAFQTELTNVGLTLEALREDRRSDILIRQLIAAETDIDAVAVSEEELQSAYDMMFAGADDSVEYADVRDLLYSETLQQKGAAVINAYVESLRVDADISINL
jgi:foldase protein PrsA